MKDRIYKEIRNATESFCFRNVNEGLTAQHLSKLLHIQRNTASHYLNQLFFEGLLIKINSRPVYFLDKETYERRFCRVSRPQYESFFELEQEFESAGVRDTVFNAIIGCQGSLKKPVEQIKAAALYPDNGLSVIFNGASGCGKSFLANILHKYCIESGVLPANAPFNTLNCAQYYNNPELLTANLFGYVKGAFTGAEKNMSGLLATSNGGTLFLDEIHRLSPEGQEKLFGFMDTGTYRQMGDTMHTQTARVRLVFATTENLEDALLSTFLRRIPVCISLPELDQYGSDEKLLYIYAALLNEVKTCGIQAEITPNALNVLLNYRFKGNIGELFTTIKYLFANLYSKNRNVDVLRISVYDLPEKLLQTKHDVSPHAATGLSVLLRPADTLASLTELREKPKQIVKEMFFVILALYADEIPFHDMEQVVRNASIRLAAERKSSGFSRPYQNLLLDVKNALRDFEDKTDAVFDEMTVEFLAGYFYTTLKTQLYFSKKNENLFREIYRKMIDGSPQEKTYQLLFDLFQRHLDKTLYLYDKVYLIISLQGNLLLKKDSVRVLVALPGTSASAIASLVNTALNKPLIDALDISVDAGTGSYAQIIANYLLERSFVSGMVLFAEERCLKAIKTISLDIPYSIITSNIFSADLITFIGRGIMAGSSLNDIWRSISDSAVPVLDIVHPKGKRQKAIIAVCFSGMGTAKKLKALLESSIPSHFNIVILEQTVRDLKKQNKNDGIFRLYEVLAVIGTVNPELEYINFISLEQLISGQGENLIRIAFANIAGEEAIRAINNNLVKNFSLYSVVSSLTILDTGKVLGNIEGVFKALEKLTGRPLPNDKKITLYIHLSCMVERLIRQVPLMSYSGVAELEQCQKIDVDNVKKALSVLEEQYSVKIPDSETAYILDILQTKTIISGEYLQKKIEAL